MKNNKWYHFGRWIEPVLSSTFWLEFELKDLGFDFFGDIRVLNGNYYLLKEDLQKTVEFVKDKMENDIEWFDRFFLICDKKIERVLYYKKHKDLSKFLKTVTELLNCSMVVELLDYGLERYIEKISKDTDTAVSDVLAQIKPYKKTLLMQYHNELKNLKEENIEAFVEKHKWVGTHVFMGESLNVEKVKKELLGNNNKKEKDIIKLPRELRGCVDMGSKLAFYRSFIVENADSVIYDYWAVVSDLGKKYNLSYDEVLLLGHKEIIRLNNDGVLPENFKERENGFGVLLENKKMRIVIGQELKKMLQECQDKIDMVSEFKGMVACKGGTIKGMVKIIEESKYISKIKKGDILVANETTPDYIIGMKTARAIITNQGGITSHAAITSRELNIPCIIGTKIATKVLKDGDLVEVDADKGIVKIIKN
ncbi:hypothetical protein KKC65_03555 [Patescibacteria group bacterium]|nr:hypothetical protein [Patescibacteria group bacterium]